MRAWSVLKEDMKQNTPSKPTKWEFKCFMLADS